MQAPAAINGGAIVAASGSAQLPRIGFKKKNLTPWTLAPNYRKTMSASRVKGLPTLQPSGGETNRFPGSPRKKVKLHVKTKVGTTVTTVVLVLLVLVLLAVEQDCWQK
jgi:hypothetical protein